MTIPFLFADTDFDSLLHEAGGDDDRIDDPLGGGRCHFLGMWQSAPNARVRNWVFKSVGGCWVGILGFVEIEVESLNGTIGISGVACGCALLRWFG